MDEDDHQSDGVGRKMLQLEPIVLQQREEDGGQWRHQTKEMGAKGRRMGVWIRMIGSTPYLSSPASSSPSGAALRAHTAHSAHPGTDKRAQVLLISQHWTAKWWCSGAETESLCIPDAWRPIGSGNVVITASGPMITAEQ
jgi:hypothetical protein